MSTEELYAMAGEARVTAEELADRLRAAREYVEAREGLDEWNVAYVYTEQLRNILGMSETPLYRLR